MRTILVIKLDSIGDMVLATPALRELRRNFPEARILLVATPQTREIVELCPHIDRIMVFEPSGRRVLRPLAWTVGLFRIGWELAAENIDLAVVLRWDTDSVGCGIAFVSGAWVRLGYSERVNSAKAEANCGNDGLLTDVLETMDPGHEVNAGLALIHHIGGAASNSDLELWLADSDRLKAREIVATLGPQSSCMVGVGIGAREGKRRWPPERYGAVCRSLRRIGAEVILFGSAHDEDEARRISLAAGGGLYDLVGRTTLRENAAILSQCRLVIANDSGLGHIAAAVGVPCVVISCHPKTGDPLHPNSPRRFRPWGVESRILQPDVPAAPCITGCSASDAHCILAVEPDLVAAAVFELLEPSRTALSISENDGANIGPVLA
jgi:heptosyltransferase-2